MTKIKALFGLTVMVGLLAISASPAFAEYESKTAEGKGSAGPTVFTVTGGTVTCASSEGTWSIRKSDKLQGKVSKGGHLNILAKKWNKCEVPGIGTATVSECEFQVVQTKKGTNKGLPVSVLKGCNIKAPLGCEITVEPKGNENLKELSQENKKPEENLLAKANVTGITYTAKSCFGISSGKTGEEKGEITGEGLKEV